MASQQQVPLLSYQQQQLQNQILQQLGPLLEGLGQPTDISPLISERIRSFQTQAAPALAEQFTAMGTSPLYSSDFAGSIGAARAGLESQLGALQAQTQFQDKGRQQQLAGLLGGLGMQPSFMTTYQPGSPGFLSGLSQSLPGALGILGLVLSRFFSGEK